MKTKTPASRKLRKYSQRTEREIPREYQSPYSTSNMLIVGLLLALVGAVSLLLSNTSTASIVSNKASHVVVVSSDHISAAVPFSPMAGSITRYTY